MSELNKKISRLKRRIAAAQLKQSKNKKLESNLYTTSTLGETAHLINTYKKQLAIFEDEYKKVKKRN